LSNYVHGYSEYESTRLQDQANTLAELLHCDTRYPAGSKVLEAGCGVGAQTIYLAANSPETRFTAVDLSPTSLAEAADRVKAAGYSNVEFQVADIFDLPFAPESFDHIFICFVLEHLPDPLAALAALKKVLKPGGTITVIEGDHGSAYFHPDSALAKKAIQCLIDYQAALGGDSLIGRRLYPLLVEAGFAGPRVSPRMVYVDDSRPELVEGFTKKTFNAMVEGVRDFALKEEMMTLEDWEQGLCDLHRTEEDDGTFCYTFFKAVAKK